ncbi:MAG: UDP-N-acetylmuramoyl-tripeptide--D-alanyl-D-alanine ligase [Nitrospirae bacterium]|nr:UDP-N-acetylmuramoyl-tripeptide--D-alanyl-D-alanine ligase [Nitrospirota bacterium]MCL5978982.1 UDP-N-acetylmuramoyl-tripeptide--D-alanyl-D-alanine ligase [Nitrospirota bacterium]
MLSVKDIIAATNGVVENSKFEIQNSNFSGVSIDSRTIKKGELFIALKGDRFDGHDFVNDALKTGEGALVISNSKSQISNLKNKPLIFVNDTLKALHDLAGHIRKGFKGNVIGVVGSNGKTTTKELISSILSGRLKVLKTAGNLNNHIGMPLSIVGLEEDTDVMVLEMGTNRPGDIDELCGIALPDIGVVTNIGFEHLQGFGSLHKVRDSELEIMPYIRKVIVNADDAFLIEGVKPKFDGEIITFGIQSHNSDITAEDIVFSDEGTEFMICAGNERIGVHSKLFGLFNIYNSLAAASAAYALGFNLREIKSGLESFGGVGMRFEVKRHMGAVFLNDVYNANPSSVRESVNELMRFLSSGKYKRAVAILGDMLELGGHGVKEHKKIGRMLSELSVDMFIGVGPLMSHAVKEFKGKGIRFDTSEEAGAELAKIIKEGDVILIKGSRGMRMERVMESLADNDRLLEGCDAV